MRATSRIKVVGVGGGGGNSVNRMIEAGVEGVEFIVVNTDLAALNRSRAPVKIQLGDKLTKGLGSGANPDIGRKAALEDTDKIIESVEGASLVIVVAGMGGGTGTGAAPIISALARELDALSVAVVSMPFKFEGKRRVAQATAGLSEMRQAVDTVFVISNERLLSTSNKQLSLGELFTLIDEAVAHAVQSISNLVTSSSPLNLNFADLTKILDDAGLGAIGFGRATGANRAEQVARQALASPLLNNAPIEHARGVIINVGVDNITGSKALIREEINTVSLVVREAVGFDANIIAGAIVNKSAPGEMTVSLLFAGLESEPESKRDSIVTERMGDAPRAVTRGQSADALIVWDPEVVDHADYVKLVTALGDLVRSEGGVGVERIGQLGIEILVSEDILV